MKNEKNELYNISLTADDISAVNDSEMDDIERYEENEDIYKWLSVLLVFIWAVSLMVF